MKRLSPRLRILWDPHSHLVRHAGARLRCESRWIEMTTASQAGLLVGHSKRCLIEEPYNAQKKRS